MNGLTVKGEMVSVCTPLSGSALAKNFCEMSNKRWKKVDDELPPLDEMGRCEDLWLYDAGGIDVVFRGSYVDFGDDDGGMEPDEFTDSAGNAIAPTHWALAFKEELEPPAPPADM